MKGPGRWLVWPERSEYAIGYSTQRSARDAIRRLLAAGVACELEDAATGRRVRYMPARAPAWSARNPRVILWEGRELVVGDDSGPPIVLDRRSIEEPHRRARTVAGLGRQLRALFAAACRVRERRIRRAADAIQALERDPRTVAFFEAHAGEKTAQDVSDFTQEVLRRRPGSLDWRGALRATVRAGGRRTLAPTWAEWWESRDMATAREWLALAGLELQPPAEVLASAAAAETAKLCRDAWEGDIEAAEELAKRLRAGGGGLAPEVVPF